MATDPLTPIATVRDLPSVEVLANQARNHGPAPIIRAEARKVIGQARVELDQGHATSHEALLASLLMAMQDRRPLRRVLNASGVLLHTNLGRAPMGQLPPAVEGLGAVAVEMDLTEGARSGRFAALAGDLADLVGAEDALVVNNNAGAILLVLSALADGGEVIVSRGQLVEIGGSFRIPEIVTQGGARLREVGTTNKTHARDIEGAIGPDSRLILEVHPSNFAQVGFTATVPTSEAAAIAHRHGLVMVHDIGSGLVDATTPWLAEPPAWAADEPAARQTLAEGADLVTFSTDKLLGGPQGGVIAGRRDLISVIRHHPLYRALRYDKVRAAHLHAVTRAHLDQRVLEAVPFWAMATASLDALRVRATALAESLQPSGQHVAVLTVTDAIGAGAAAAQTLPGFGIAIDHPSPDSLAAALRRGGQPVVARVHQDRLVVSLRAIDPADDELLAGALTDAIRGHLERTNAVIIATAGHVDHGKSTLVRLLTGTDPDRWAEEKRRGLTIDLGFAWVDLAVPANGDPVAVGFVDVPGHRSFLSNMLAGCGAVDIALLVVSAREGWMNQTEEHVQILHLLGVTTAVAALTHIDTVDHQQVLAARAQVTQALIGTALEGSPIVGTAATDPATITDLAAALGAAAEERVGAGGAGDEPAFDRPRLWIDRSFTLAGPGRVVTGTLAGGRLAVDDQIDVISQQTATPVRVRGLHVNGSSAPEATPGMRVGVSVAGSDEPPERGDALAHAEHWLSGHRWQVAITSARGRKPGPIPARGGYQVFVGTARVAAQLRYRQGSFDDLVDGDPTLARIYLSAPLAPISLGDRFIIRDEGADVTVGGGVILAADSADVRYRKEDLIARWRAITTKRAPAGQPLTPASRVALGAVLLDQSDGALPTDRMDALVGPGPLWGPLVLPGDDDRDGLAEVGSWVVRCQQASRRSQALLAEVATGVRVAEPTDLLGLVMAAELAERGLIERRGGYLSRPGVADHRADLTEAEQIVTRLLDRTTPPLAENDDLLSSGVGGRLRADLVSGGRLVEVGPFVTTPTHLDAMIAVIRETMAHGGATVSEVRQAMGISRRYAVPLLEYLDQVGLTERTGNERRWSTPGDR